MFFFDPTYLIFMIPAFILMGITSWYVTQFLQQVEQSPRQQWIDRRASCTTT